jgi:hypothetical protein
METIKDLLHKLDNQVPASMARRLDGLHALQQKFHVAKEEYEANPTEDNEESFEDIKQYITDQTEDIVDDLKILVRRKKFQEEEEKASQNSTAPKGDEKPKGDETPKGDEKPKEEEKSGLGMFGWIFGGALLVASFGAINYFRNNR